MPDDARLAGQPAVLVLDQTEIAEVGRLIERLLARYPSAMGQGFLRAAALTSHDLPERLRAFLLAMRSGETYPALIVSGFAVDDSSIGPTPEGWGRQPDPCSTSRETAWLTLCGSILGDLFGWATQQDGAIVQDIAPARGNEYSQVGSSSAELLWWHTEDAFHPLRCDYLGLLCLRNHDGVATTIASVDDIELSAEFRKILFGRRFIIRPDDSHLAVRAEEQAWPTGRRGDFLRTAQEQIEQMNSRPEPVALLFGDFDSPYLSIDPFYMDLPDADPEARRTFEALCGEIESMLVDITISPGEILFIDNFRAVHGRNPFEARYDGTDRWLKRINVSRDLRKSRSKRLTCESRVVY